MFFPLAITCNRYLQSTLTFCFRRFSVVLLSPGLNCCSGIIYLFDVPVLCCVIFLLFAFCNEICMLLFCRFMCWPHFVPCCFGSFRVFSPLLFCCSAVLAFFLLPVANPPLSCILVACMCRMRLAWATCVGVLGR